ncbi:MAG: magnesium transporter CorA family protein [Deltaproteobacteria bacterium]|nr:magnesium transporter CorA family protein [Deltaproteobacteria bacterium]
MIRSAISSAHGEPALIVGFDEAIAAAMAPDPPRDLVVWIDASAPSAEELASIETTFALHPLTVEDLSHRNQRAKLEEYPGYLFLVLHWFASLDLRHNAAEVHCILGKNWLVTLVDGVPVQPIETAWGDFVRGHARPPAGADGELYRILDHIVDGHVPVLTAFEDRLERLSASVTHDSEQDAVDKVITVRRSLVHFRRALAPQRDVLSALARREHSLVSEKSLLYFRDVSDHVQREYEAVESLRELAQSVIEVQFAVRERMQSQIIKRLTVISTVFLPLNFLTGFFGMNFAHLPFADDRLLYTALTAMATLPTGLMLWFRKRRWL